MSETLELNKKQDIELSNRLNKYTYDNYCDDIESLGLDKTWQNICKYLKHNGENVDGILQIDNFGELYEKGLAIADKNKKKSSGQYYTPDDVAVVMAKWLVNLKGDNICDVACGTGNLILTYLKLLGKTKAKEILSKNNLYLYDSDMTALNVCKSIILYTYGYEFEDNINIVCGDFLDKNTKLPENCKVITNPPYANISELPKSWAKTEVQRDTKELYSSFMEKIIEQSVSSVIISPYSFLGGTKFYTLRKIMNNYSGFVVSFDNVPGTIFCGKKHGIFNTNTSNSVRAAITVIKGESEKKYRGFQISPLIRFKAIERDRLLQNEALESFLTSKRQQVSDTQKMYVKCDGLLEEVFEKWCSCSLKTLRNYVVGDNGKYSIFMPNTCRYYTTASSKKLNRNGQICLKFDNEDIFNYVYCLINSSFAYWHWRLYDGGITYPKNLLLNMPVFFDKLTDKDKEFLKITTQKMISSAPKYTVVKNNVGIQENIKYPKSFRDEINQKFLEILNVNKNADIFDIVHSERAFT